MSEPARRPLRLAYLMSRFPKATETFILYEILELERLGHRGPETRLDVRFLDLVDEVLAQGADLVLVGRDVTHQELPAELGPALAQQHAVASRRRGERRGHSGRPAADDENAPRLGRRRLLVARDQRTTSDVDDQGKTVVKNISMVTIERVIGIPRRVRRTCATEELAGSSASRSTSLTLP